MLATQLSSAERRKKRLARREAEGLLKATPHEPKALFGLAYALADEGSHRAATDVAKQALALTPDDPLALCAYAEIVHAGGHDREARQAAARAVKLAPSLPLAHVTLGLANLSSPLRVGRAERAFREALRLDPANRTARNGLRVIADRRAKRAPASRLATTILAAGWAATAVYAVEAGLRDQPAPRLAAWTWLLLVVTLCAWTAIRIATTRRRARKLSPAARRRLLDEERDRAWHRWLLLLVSAIAVALLWLGLWTFRPETNAPSGFGWELVAGLCVAIVLSAVKVGDGLRAARPAAGGGSTLPPRQAPARPRS